MVNRLVTLTISILLINIQNCQIIDLSADLASLVEQVNSLKSTWTAAVDSQFDSVSDDVLRQRLGAAVDQSDNDTSNSIINITLGGGNRLLAGNTYPAFLDLRTKYPKCKSISTVGSQGQCGSCWAFSSMNSLSDRYCIANYNSGNPTQRSFSPQDPLECCTNCASNAGSPCDGGYIKNAFAFASTTGVSTGDAYGNSNLCKPYFLADTSKTYSEPKCQKACSNPSKYKTTLANDRLKSKGYKTGTGETAMIAALNNGGSIAVTFTVYKDLYAYKSGIYQHVSGASLGAHAVRIIGYGAENGVKYWIAANSWNSSWGEKGYFRIRRGNNECNIETNMFAYGTF